MDVYRVIFTGWRFWPAAHRSLIVDALDERLDKIWQEHPDVPVVLVHGAGGNADRMADAWARSMPGVTPEPRPADWPACGPDCPDEPHRRVKNGREYCPNAGGRRDAYMVSLGANECVGAPGPAGRVSGTRKTMGMARRAGIEVTATVKLPGAAQ